MGSLEPGSLCSPPSPAEQDEFPLANESIPEASNRNGFAGGGTARVRRLMIATRIWRPNFPLLFFLKPKPPPVPTKSTCVRGIIPEPGPGPDQSIIIDLRARPSPIAHLPSSPRSLPNETKKLTDCPSGCRLRATELQMGRPIPVKNGPRRLGGI